MSVAPCETSLQCGKAGGKAIGPLRGRSAQRRRFAVCPPAVGSSATRLPLPEAFFLHAWVACRHACGEQRQRAVFELAPAAAPLAADQFTGSKALSLTFTQQHSLCSARLATAAAGAMAAGGEPTDEAAQPTPAGLLELPDNLLHAIFSQLSSVADLAAVAASCSALRALVWGSSWDQATTLAANVYTPGLPATLRWAAERMPRVRGSVLHAVRFVFALS